MVPVEPLAVLMMRATRVAEHKLPSIDTSANKLGALQREKESVIRRQSQAMKKLEWDRLTVINGIEACKLKTREMERNIQAYKLKIEEMAGCIRRLREKSADELKTARAECNQHLKCIAALTKQEREQETIIQNLKRENDTLRGFSQIGDESKRRKPVDFSNGRKPMIKSISRVGPGVVQGVVPGEG